jgi:hypothetical protein
MDKKKLEKFIIRYFLLFLAALNLSFIKTAELFFMVDFNVTKSVVMVA